jgi:PPOX class probable F420-dependent enzyme
MTSIHDSGPQELLNNPNYATVATMNRDGSIHQTLVWINAEGDQVAVNSAVGRLWPSNLDRDPRVSVVVQENDNPYHFLEIRGTATGTLDGADEHIDALAKKYTGEDKYPYRRPGEQRIRYTIRPEHVRYVKQR